jgi:hypothetical protein
MLFPYAPNLLRKDGKSKESSTLELKPSPEWQHFPPRLTYTLAVLATRTRSCALQGLSLPHNSKLGTEIVHLHVSPCLSMSVGAVSKDTEEVVVTFSSHNRVKKDI